MSYSKPHSKSPVIYKKMQDIMAGLNSENGCVDAAIEHSNKNQFGVYQDISIQLTYEIESEQTYQSALIQAVYNQDNRLSSKGMEGVIHPNYKRQAMFFSKECTQSKPDYQIISHSNVLYYFGDAAFSKVKEDFDNADLDAIAQKIEMIKSESSRISQKTGIFAGLATRFEEMFAKEKPWMREYSFYPIPTVTRFYQ